MLDVTSSVSPTCTRLCKLKHNAKNIVVVGTKTTKAVAGAQSNTTNKAKEARVAEETRDACDAWETEVVLKDLLLKFFFFHF